MPQLSDYSRFLHVGYSLRELMVIFLRLKVVSWLWTRFKYTLRRRGARVCIDYTVDIAGAGHIAIGDDSWIQRHVWLTVPLIDMAAIEDRCYLSIGRRVQIGRNTCIAAAHAIELADDVLVAPHVTIADHAHHYADRSRPVKDQGITDKGFVRIGRGAWIATGATILGHRGVTIGEHAVVAAQSVVMQDVPPYCVVAGNPAKVVKQLRS